MASFSANTLSIHTNSSITTSDVTARRNRTTSGTVDTVAILTNARSTCHAGAVCARDAITSRWGCVGTVVAMETRQAEATDIAKNIEFQISNLQKHFILCFQTLRTCILRH